MRSDLIVERQLLLHTLVRCPDGLIRVQVDLLVCEASPQPFHEYVVSPAPVAVHADVDAMLGQQPRELLARELASLVRVEDRWGTILRDGFLHRIQAEISGQRVGQPPR